MPGDTLRIKVNAHGAKAGVELRLGLCWLTGQSVKRAPGVGLKGFMDLCFERFFKRQFEVDSLDAVSAR